jgi:hypothetical protein
VVVWFEESDEPNRDLRRLGEFAFPDFEYVPAGILQGRQIPLVALHVARQLRLPP